MTRKNALILLIIVALFAFALCALIFPMFGREQIRLGLDLQGGIHMVYQADLSSVEPGKEAEAIEGALTVIKKRIDILGVTEPVIQRQGEDRLLIELPGISEVEKAKKLIGQTALLEFGELVIEEGEEAKWVNELGKWKPATAIIDGQEKELTSAYFEENTYVDRDSLGRILLLFEWNEEGAKLSEEITGRLIGQPLGIFLGDESLLGEDGTPIAPVVREKITDRGQIEGLSWIEATELSKLLNAGRIPIPLTAIYEQSVSPILGSDFVDMSIKAGLIGIVLVMLFMIIYYRLPGVLASLALIFYGTVVLALFKLIPVTLTLAGIGGFVLSIGMAVDANVLIFERMKEELRAGRTLGAAIEAGFSRAWTAIRDSNVTTFIVCGILYWLGSSIVASAPVMGFALTLFLGVAVSMFTAIVVTLTLLRLFVGTRLAQQTRLFSMYAGRE
ncbi:MAG: protein translocase subunit SecD [Chloroflexi bacterium]|nr:protein translocase subunit SecD [Chloroflexota bacterium]